MFNEILSITVTHGDEGIDWCYLEHPPENWTLKLFIAKN